MGATGSRGLALAGCSGKRLFGNYDLRIILQLVKAAIGHHIAGVDTRHRGHIRVSDTRLDITNLRRVVLDNVYERRLAVVLNGGGRNQRDSLQGVHQQPGVYELVGKQRAVFVFEEGSHLDRAGGGIDLVIEGQQFSRGQLGLLTPVESVDAQAFPVSHLRLHLCEVVFRNGEDYGDWLQLCDHCQSRGPACLNDVAGIHQPQAYATVDRRRNVAEGDLDLLVLHRTLVVFYRALILQDELFLVVERLLGNAVPRPCVAVTLKIHLRLGKDIGIAFECALGLQELRLEGAGIDIDQWLPLANQLAFLVMDFVHQAGHFAGDGVGIDRRDGTDRIQVDPDISLIGDGRGNRDRPGHTSAG